MKTSRTQTICEWAQVQPQSPLPCSKVGLAMSSLKRQPIHGMRIAPTETTNGWYIWCGDLSDADDFFSPLHVEHLDEHLPAAAEYLDLPPGYRFLIDGANYEDVWFDASLLEQS
ncbi:hypothetical protein ACG04R_24700 [Roseateles sp. BYS78W]|uniref:Imm33-like domain-containing protein n=1 Tax=Pelomonas candidula TaxID=3299025 RepID=A0ABW7HJ00_9BURK